MSRYELLDTEPIGKDDAQDEGWAEWSGFEDRPSAVGDGKTWRAPVVVDLCAVCKELPEAVADCERRELARS